MTGLDLNLEGQDTLSVSQVFMLIIVGLYSKRY